MPDGMAGGVDGQIKVSFAGLAQGAADISRSAAMIDNRLGELKTDIGKLVAGWEGEAATTYQVHQKNWDDAAAELQRVLATIGTAVRTAGEDYQAGERKNTSRWV